MGGMKPPAPVIGSCRQALNSVASKIRKLSGRLAELAGVSSDYGKMAETMESISYQISDLQRSIMDADSGGAGNELDIDSLNAALAKINRLKRKYKLDEQGLIALFEKTRSDLDLLENVDAEKQARQQTLEQALRKLNTSAEGKALCRILYLVFDLRGSNRE